MIFNLEEANGIIANHYQLKTNNQIISQYAPSPENLFRGYQVAGY